VRVYVVDSKGKQSKGARIPSQDLIALGTTLAKGCAILTATPAGEFRVSFR
jgi:pSer/pThr/pTyr-binding forkhead associated (FHA) protein